jgi:hypothetical protein
MLPRYRHDARPGLGSHRAGCLARPT